MADDASERTRGVANRGVESNMKRGEVHTIVPGKTYNVVGFDIGKADLKKPGFEKELEPVVKQLQRERKEFIDGKRATHPVVTITGHASESVRPGKGPQVYASERADAVKQYLIKRDIPLEWIQTTTSRESAESRRVNVGGSPERKALARSATIEVGESENVARAAHRRGLENRYADPPEYLTLLEYKRLPRPDLARQVDMPRPPDMLPAPIKWQWTPLDPVKQFTEVDCWAAALSYWLALVRSPKAETQRELINHEKAFEGIGIPDFIRVAGEHGMTVKGRFKRADFSADRIKERLAVSPLILSYNVAKEEEEWWHDVVVYGARTDSSGKTTYAIMDPGPIGEALNLDQARGHDNPGLLLEVEEKYFFPPKGTGQWVIGWSKMAVKR